MIKLNKVARGQAAVKTKHISMKKALLAGLAAGLLAFTACDIVDFGGKAPAETPSKDAQLTGTPVDVSAIPAGIRKVFVLNALDLDGDDAPEMEFAADPAAIERLAGDGTWKSVEFRRTGPGRAQIASPVLTQRPAIFRWR